MPRRFRLFAIAGILLVIAGSAAVASASADNYAQVCYRYQTMPVKNSRYIVMNNVWGATTGQCLDVAADGAFRVAQTAHHNVGTAASFPSIYAGCHWGNCSKGTSMPLRVDEIRSARSSWRIATGAPGVWSATYDIWFHTSVDINRSPDGAELLIWLDHSAGANPNGKLIARNVRVAGSLWDVWYEDTAWNYVAYVRQSRTSSTRNLDLRAFTADAMGRGYIKPSWYLSGVEAGFEIWSGGAGLASRSFSVTVASGSTARPGEVTSTGPTTTEPHGPAATPSGSTPSSPASGATSPPVSGVSRGTARRSCTVRWSSTSWDSGMVADVVVVNHGPPLTGWNVRWDFREDEEVDSGWGAEVTQSGRHVVAANAPYNAVLGTGSSETFGFQASHGGAPRRPTEFRLNGTRCALE